MGIILTSMRTLAVYSFFVKSALESVRAVFGQSLNPSNYYFVTLKSSI